VDLAERGGKVSTLGLPFLFHFFSLYVWAGNLDDIYLLPYLFDIFNT